jgi:hypothetical protein
MLPKNNEQSISHRLLPFATIFLSLKGGSYMQVIPVSSKQIAFVSYDDQTSQIHIHYHTGAITICGDIGQEQVGRLLLSDKPYDFIMALTCAAGQKGQAVQQA